MKQQRCAELQIPHSNPQTLKQYRRMNSLIELESVYCTTKCC